MPTIAYSLGPAAAPALCELYRTYDWWADRRGEGLGRELMAAVVAHPALSDVAPSLLARGGRDDQSRVRVSMLPPGQQTGRLAHPARLRGTRARGVDTHGGRGAGV